MASEERVYNVNILGETLIATPAEIKSRLGLSERAEETVISARRTIEAILDGRDPRLLVVCGPCSIHNHDSALDYATRLKALSIELADRIYLAMRVYFEKPRTTIGWKGFINDPHLDDSFCIDEGLYLARRLLLEINELGLGAGTEALDPLVPQYLSDLVSWYAVGARTTESQVHRELASGLSAPVGFKNGTDGGLDVAIAAIKAASSPHSFLGVTQDGRAAVYRTCGNRYAHLVLRGGRRPNYYRENVLECEQILKREGLRPCMLIDCSHGNSLKDPSRQPLVLRDCVSQIREGSRSIVGLMLESNLFGGRQDIPADLSQLRYGVSVTDACLGFDETAELLRFAAQEIKSPSGNKLIN